MMVEVLTLRYDTARGGLDDSPLQAFLRDKIVLAVHDHFFTVGVTPHLVLVITFRLAAPSPLERPARSSDTLKPTQPRPSTDDLRRELDSGTRDCFDLLRRWRSARAHDEGVPAYAILTNRQLLELARLRPASKAALQRVEGLGRRTAERFGQDILQVLGKARSDLAEQPPASGEAHTLLSTAQTKP